MSSYWIIPDGETAFAVVICFPSGREETMRGFQTEADAAAWVLDRQTENAARRWGMIAG